MKALCHSILVLGVVFCSSACSRQQENPPEFAQVDATLNRILHGVIEYEKTAGPYPSSLSVLASSLPPDFTNAFSSWPPVDPWGTGVRYAKSSETNCEIRSAGPDRAFMTLDDFMIIARGKPLGMIDMPSDSPPAFSGTNVEEIVEFLKKAKDTTQQD